MKIITCAFHGYIEFYGETNHWNIYCKNFLFQISFIFFCINWCRIFLLLYSVDSSGIRFASCCWVVFSWFILLLHPQIWNPCIVGVETTRHFLLEWLSYTCRYVPVGLLEIIPQRINWRPPSYYGRDDLETLMASDSAADWVWIIDNVHLAERRLWLFTMVC